jgi:tetratricopeptide (TPR) repeat protein
MRRTSNHNSLSIAEEHRRAGRLGEAEKKCRGILLQNPDDAGALSLAARLARQQGRIGEAVEFAARAAHAHPHVAELHADLGDLSRAAGMREQAIAALARAVQLKPLDPRFHNGLAAAYFENRQIEQALEVCDRAVQLGATDAYAWSNRSGVLRELGRFEEAADMMDRALQLQPDLAPSHLNMGLIRAGQERLSEAMDCTARAIALRPDFAEAHYTLGILQLLLGDLERGWPEYQWRPTRKALTGKPLWRGEDPSGRTVLLLTEQGFGDAIQFVRYVPMLEERGARVVLTCRAELARLLEQIVRVVRPGEALPPHDLWCPLLDLPMVFGTNIQNIPARIPYLKAAPIAEKSRNLRVGLVWAGSPTHRDDYRRSIRFEQLKPILDVPGIEWVNLQVGPAARQAEGSPFLLPPIEPRDFADTAAVLAGLDLTVSVDTAVAHLAGAIGKPVWILLAKVPDWRWLLGRPDSPWYPTMRLFRQHKYGDWEGPIREAAQQLLEFPRAGR